MRLRERAAGESKWSTWLLIKYALSNITAFTSLPLHLITDASLRDTMFAAVQPGTPYTCGIDKLPDGQTLSGMFRAFYEASGLYTVTTSDKGFTLVPRGGAQELMFQFGRAGRERPVHDHCPAGRRAAAQYQRRCDLRQRRSCDAARKRRGGSVHRAAAGQL